MAVSRAAALRPDAKTVLERLRPFPFDSPTQFVKRFLMEKEPVYASLMKITGRDRERSYRFWRPHVILKRDGNHTRRTMAKSPSDSNRHFKFWYAIGNELEEKTKAFSTLGGSGGQKKILDLDTESGGVLLSALNHNPQALACAFTLPNFQGRYMHDINPKVSSLATIAFLDIGMLAGEFGISADGIPSSHPDYGNFNFDRPFVEHKFHLVMLFKDQLIRTDLAEYRLALGNQRQRASRLVLAMERIAEGGTFIAALSRSDTFRTIMELSQIRRFADIQLFKSTLSQTERISPAVQLIAKNVRRQSRAAQHFVESEKAKWLRGTLDVLEDKGSLAEKLSAVASRQSNRVQVEDVLRDFGDEFAEMGRPVWEIQVEAMKEWNIKRGYSPMRPNYDAFAGKHLRWSA